MPVASERPQTQTATGRAQARQRDIAEAVVLFDAPPLTRDLSRIADFSATVAYSAVSAQLFRWESSARAVVPGAACAKISTSDFQYYEFEIADGLTWHDGSSVRAADYVRRFLHVVGSRAPIASRFREVVDIGVARSSKANGRTFYIRSRSPDALLAAKLAHPALGPMHGSRTDATPFAAGPFQLSAMTDQGAVLERRSRRSAGVQRIRLEYEANADVAVSRYEARQADVTCSALFPLQRLQQLRDRSDFHPACSNTFIVLLPVTDRATRVRHPISRILSRDQIAALLPGGLSVVASFCDMAPESALGEGASGCNLYDEPASVRDTQSYDALTIAYDGFTPNDQVVGAICNQLSAAGCRVTAVTDDYVRPRAACDFRLMVVTNSEAYPGDIYGRLLSSPILAFDRDAYEDVLVALAAFDGATTELNRHCAAQKLDALIAKKLPVIPLVRLNQFYLKNASALSAFTWDSDAMWDSI